MRFIVCADLHIRSTRPRFRKDDYFKTVCRKLRHIVQLCNKYEVDLIIAGDIFDTVKVGYKVLNRVIQILRVLRKKCYVVAGQHDMLYHNNSLVASPLMTLVYTRSVTLLSRNTPVQILATWAPWLYCLRIQGTSPGLVLIICLI